jgi:hypothetical protein
MEDGAGVLFKKRTADFAAASEKIGETRGQDWQVKREGQNK